MLNEQSVPFAVERIEKGFVDFQEFSFGAQFQIIDYMIANNKTALLHEAFDNYRMPKDGLTLQERIVYYQLFVKDKTNA